MGIAEWILLIFVALPPLNLLFLFLYCHIEARIDKKRILSKAAEKTKADTDAATSSQEKRGTLRRLYNWLNGYLYGWMRYSLLLIGRFPSNRIRNWILRFVCGMKITKNTVISGGCEIRSPWNIQADRCIIAAGCLLDGRKGITIGQNTVFGANVHIWTEEHDVNDSWFAVTPEHAQPVTIGSHVWICSDSSLLPGTVVGEGAVIATRACVVRNCEPYGIYGGVPAKKIGERNQDLRYTLSGKPHWHFY